MTQGLSPRSARRSALTGLAGSLALIAAMPAHAQTTTAPGEAEANPAAVAVLGGDDAAPAASGRIAVNLAAGSGHQEANAASVAIAAGGAALAGVSVAQLRDPPAAPASILPAPASPAHAAIVGDALAGATGMIAVNVTAGRDNQLANLAGIAIGATAATSLQLAQASAPTTPTTNDPQTLADGPVAELSATAFQDASGLVQVNVIGGDRNAASNSFALAMASGGTP